MPIKDLKVDPDVTENKIYVLPGTTTHSSSQNSVCQSSTCQHSTSVIAGITRGYKR